MSMSTHVVGFRPRDATWQQFKAIYDNCTAAGINVPDKVNEFFNWMEPDERGIVVELSHADGHDKNPDAPVSSFQDDSSQGLIVDLAKLPSGVTHLKFYNSW